MGISLVLFKRSFFNSKQIKKSFYLNLLNLSRKDFAMQKKSLKFNAFYTLLKGYKSEEISKETGPIRPWIRIYFLNQEIQYQIYKNHRFSNKNSRVFEKITKISLFGELNIIYFILNKFFIKLRNLSTFNSESRKANRTHIYERSIYKKVSNSCFNKNLFFLNVNLFKSWFFYFFNKKNKKVRLSQNFIKNLKALSSDEEFYRSSLLLYKNIKTFSRIPFSFLNNKYSKLNKNKIFDSPNFSKRNFQLNYGPLLIKKNNNNNQLIVFRKVTKGYDKSNFVNSQPRTKSSFLIKKLFYKAYFFNFLQACFKTQSYFKVMPMDRNQKSIPSFYQKTPKSNKTKLKTRKFLNLGKLSLDGFNLKNQDDDSLFLKKVTKSNFEVMKNKNLLKQNVSLFIKLKKLLECLSFEPKFLLYLRSGTKNLVLNKQSYLEIKITKQVEILKKKKIIQSYSLLSSNFLKIGSNYFNPKNIFRFKNPFDFTQYYFREKIKIKKFISKGKNTNSSYFFFPNLRALNGKILREFLIDSKQLKNLKNIKNLFPKLTESFFLNKKRNDFFLNLTFYKLFLEIHENLYFLRKSKNYFLLKILTLKFDSIFKNYLLSKKTFNVIHTINYEFFSNLELFKVYRKLKNFLLHFYQMKKKKN